MKSKSRTHLALLNATCSLVGKAIITLLGVVSRWLIIKNLGADYLGINGLFSNILGLLSLSEMGIHLSVQYSLYKPIADNDQRQICAVMNFYKKVYAFIILTIVIFGVTISFFINRIIGTDTILNAREIYVYYYIFLFNTAASYLSTHVATVICAEQKGYQIANIETITNTLSAGIQIVILLLSNNYVAYLLSNSAALLFSKIFIISYAKKTHPYFQLYRKETLKKQEIKRIRSQVSSLAVHKLGEVSVTQTDNIIVTLFSNLSVVGVISNYLLIINILTTFLSTAFNSVISGIGNVLTTESIENKYRVFIKYNFICKWVFGVTAVCVWVLADSFITLCFGAEYCINRWILLFLVINYYMLGLRMSVNNTKSAAGVFEQDKYVSFVQGIANLFFSIILVYKIGVTGVYLGTVISGLIPTIIRPAVLYKNVFQKSPLSYYLGYIFDASVFLRCCNLSSICIYDGRRKW